MWEEERERKYLKKMNSTFHKFTKLVEKSAGDNHNIEFDIPYKEQGFFGVPKKTTVFLQPSVRCLVHLVEGPPWFILCLDDVEIAHFERVNFNLKSFDLTFVFKDYTRLVETISSIPVDNLEDIKQWLDSNNIKFYQGNANLNWTKIMQTIREEPKAFFEDGGWSFLDMDAADGENEEPEDEEEESFAPGGEEEEDDFAPSQDVHSDDLDEHQAAAAEDEEEEEEAVSWDELENKAKEEDSKRTYFEEEQDPAKRKRSMESSLTESNKRRKK